MASLTSSCLWRTRAEVIIALQNKLGEPLDAYVNGSQVWLREDGPNEITLEWRLHPVANYVRPPSMSTLEVFTSVAFRLLNEADMAVAPETLWGGLECFVAFDEEVEPIVLASAAHNVLGLTPDAVGLVDHATVGNAWERSGGAIDIAAELMAQLTQPI